MENFFKMCQDKPNSQSKPHENGKCLIWTGCRNKGYGQVRYKDPRDPYFAGLETRSVHRMTLMVKVKDLDLHPE